jgi:septal ring factor EnvC (AmiA/AmiB activator)
VTEKTGQQTVISNLKSEEQKLKQKLRKYEEEKIRIQNTIAELIRKEAEAAAKAEAERRAKEKRKAEAAAKAKAEAKKAADTKAAAEQAAKDKAAGKKPATTPKPEVVKEEPKSEPKRENYDVLSPEQRLISNRFDENKGLMPWPVQRGIIVYKFGKQPHSVLKDIMEQKNGVGFSTSQGATARSIFDGQVTNVLPLSANNFAVMIKHGEYITVYVNVKNIKVAVGQKVTAKQEIGQVYTNPEDDRTTLELQVWKGTVLQNPIGWIAKQ